MQCGVSATDKVGQAWSLVTTHSSTVWVPTMIGVGQALSVATVDLSKYQMPLILERACLALYHGFFGDLGYTHLLACQWSGWREISVELTYHTISRLHIFCDLFSTYDNFIYLYLPHLLESGGHRKGIANEVRGSKHTDTI